MLELPSTQSHAVPQHLPEHVSGIVRGGSSSSSSRGGGGGRSRHRCGTIASCAAESYLSTTPGEYCNGWERHGWLLPMSSSSSSSSFGPRWRHRTGCVWVLLTLSWWPRQRGAWWWRIGRRRRRRRQHVVVGSNRAVPEPCTRMRTDVRVARSRGSTSSSTCGQGILGGSVRIPPPMERREGTAAGVPYRTVLCLCRVVLPSPNKRVSFLAVANFFA